MELYRALSFAASWPVENSTFTRFLTDGLDREAEFTKDG